MTPAKTCPRCEDFAADARKVLSERSAPPETSWSVEYATAALCAHLWGPKQAGL